MPPEYVRTVRSAASLRPICSSTWAASRRAPAGGGAEETSDHDDVLSTRHRGLHRRRLAGESHEPAHRTRVASNIDAVDAQRPRVGAEQRRHQIDEGRLARAVRSEQSHDLTGPHGQIQPVEGTGLAESLDEAGRLEC